MISSLTKTLLAGLSVLTIVESFCPLCETGADTPKRWDFRLQDGRTCKELFIELAGLSPDDDGCIDGKEANQEDCCGYEEPEPYDFPPTDASLSMIPSDMPSMIPSDTPIVVPSVGRRGHHGRHSRSALPIGEAASDYGCCDAHVRPQGCSSASAVFGQKS